PPSSPRVRCRTPAFAPFGLRPAGVGGAPHEPSGSAASDEAHCATRALRALRRFRANRPLPSATNAQQARRRRAITTPSAAITIAIGPLVPAPCDTLQPPDTTWPP